jgi:GrpB-like predicted nucleotidyltransferase (UPF0157 family)
MAPRLANQGEWVSRFRHEERALARVFGEHAVAIEHVGSTAGRA